MRILRVLIVIGFTLLFASPVEAVQFTRPKTGTNPDVNEYIFETIPGNTAIYNEIPKSESILSGGSIIQVLQRFVSVISALGENAAGEPVFIAPDYKREATLFEAVNALAPKSLQERFWFPQDHLSGASDPNALLPQLAGKAGSTKSTTEICEALEKVIVAIEPPPNEYYDSIAGNTYVAAIQGALHRVDSNEEYLGNGMNALKVLTPRRQIYTTDSSGNNILTDIGALFDCGSRSEGTDLDGSVDIRASGIISPQNNNLNVNIPQSNFDLLNFARGLWELGVCATTPTDPTCQDVLQTLGLSQTLTLAMPGLSGHSCVTVGEGCRRSDLPANLPEDAKINLSGMKGGFQTFKPGAGAWGTYTDGLTDSAGETQNTITVGADGSNTTVQKDIPWQGVDGVKKTVNFVRDCALIPKTQQKTDCRIQSQHGIVPAPGELTSALPGGALGMEYLQQFPSNLITDVLSFNEWTQLMERINALIDKYVKTGAWPGSQLANTQYQNQIHEFARANGYNEAFLYSLWLEETHASSVGTFPFGCGGYTDFTSSLNCLATDPTLVTYIRDPLPEALCRYADGHFPCNFSAHPNFIRNLFGFYTYLTGP